MRFLPYFFTTQRPRGSDTDKPVSFCVITQDAKIEKEQPKPDWENDIRANCDSDIPQKYVSVQWKQEEEEQNDESIIIGPELLNVCLQGVDSGDSNEQEGKASHNTWQQGQSPEFCQIPIYLALRVPMRSHLLWHVGRKKDANDERAQNDRPNDDLTFLQLQAFPQPIV